MPYETKYLIINADDFNYTNGVSRGILHGARQGVITSTTVFVTEKKSAELRRLRRFKALSIGLHFNLICGKACAGFDRVRSLCDDSGFFKKRSIAFWQRCNKAEVEEELRAQIKRFGQWFMRMPSHIDSHHHIHSNKRIYSVLKKVALDYDIPVRKSNLDRKSNRSKVSVSDFALYRFGGGLSWNERLLAEALASVQPGITELIVHPGFCDSALKYKSSLTLQREAELSALESRSFRTALKCNRIQLINFYGLKRLQSKKRRKSR